MTKDPTEADVEALIAIFDASDWEELHISSPDFELFLSKRAGASPSQSSASVTTCATPSRPENLPSERSQVSEIAPKSGTPGVQSARPSSWTAVSAPNLGTFYRSPKPGEPAFVEIGQHVDAVDQLCLLEVMKLFTSVVAGSSGVIREICVENGAMVEMGQVLFWIEAVA